jgi:tetratricopeptide (TPR) repeat protein
MILHGSMAAAPWNPRDAKKWKRERKKLRSRLAGDLDNILLHALRKNPAERYSSVEQFSEDIQRHLVGRPIRARRQTLSYRLTKCVRRNVAASIATALMLLAVIAGMGAVLWAERAAQLDRDRAERRFNDVRSLAHSLMFEIHDAIEPLAGSMRARELVVQTAWQYLDALVQGSGDDARLMAELAAAYERIGDVQGNPDLGNRGDSAGALRSFQRALHLRERILRANSADTERRRDLARSFSKVGGVQQFVGDLDGALHSLQSAESILVSLATEQPNDRDVQIEVGEIAFDIGRTLERKGDRETAIPRYRQELTIFQALADAYPTDVEIRRLLSLAYKQNGVILARSGDTHGALTLLGKALAIDQSSFDAHPSPRAREDLSFAHSDLGLTLTVAEEFQQARSHYAEALALRLRLCEESVGDARVRRYLANTYVNIGEMSDRARDWSKAAPNYERGVALLEELAALDARNAVVRRDLAMAYYSLASSNGQQARAERERHRRVALLRSAKSLYQRSEEQWRRMEEEGTSPKADKDFAARVRRDLERCQAELTALRPPRNGKGVPFTVKRGADVG